MSEPRVATPPEHGKGYRRLRTSLFAWGCLLLGGMLIGGLMRAALPASPEAQPVTWRTWLATAGASALGLLLCLPFSWLARHRTVTRLLLVVIAPLIVWRLVDAALDEHPVPQFVMVFVLMLAPGLVAVWMIAHERRSAAAGRLR